MLAEPWTKVLILCLSPAVLPHYIINHRGAWKVESAEPGWRPGVSRWWPLQPISPWLVSLFWHCCEGESFWCYWFGRRAKERKDRSLADSGLRSAAQPVFVRMCANEKYISVQCMWQYQSACVSLLQIINYLYVALYHNTMLYSGGNTFPHISFYTYSSTLPAAHTVMHLQLKRKCNRYACTHTHTQLYRNTDNCSCYLLCIPCLSLWPSVLSVKALRLKLCSKTAYLAQPRFRWKHGVFLGISLPLSPILTHPHLSRLSSGYSHRAASVSSGVISQTGKTGTGSIKQSPSLQDIRE